MSSKPIDGASGMPGKVPEMTMTPTAEAVPDAMNSKSAVPARKGDDEACHGVTAFTAAWAGIPNRWPPGPDIARIDTYSE